MAQPVLNEVSALGDRDLDQVAQVATGDADLMVEPSWTVVPVVAPSRAAESIALLRLQGSASAGDRTAQWSCVLKVVPRTGQPVQNELRSGDREVRAYASGLVEGTAGGLRPALLYRVDEHPDQAWMWLEDLSGYRGPPWDVDHYVQAARHIGQFAGVHSTAESNPAAWLAEGLILERWSWENTAVRFADQISLLSGPARSTADRVMKGLATVRSRVKTYPMTLAHGDCHARNLFVSPPGADHSETVAIDWAGVGYGPLGTDVGTMVGSSLTWGDAEAALMVRHESEIFAAFVDGLRTAGWQGTDTEARLSHLFGVCGYGTYVAAFPGIVEQRVEPWEFVLERFSSDAARLEQSCHERLEYIATLIDEALLLL